MNGVPNAASTMLSTNRANLVIMHLQGEIAPASVPSSLYDVGIEPAVSIRAKDDRANVGFCVLACVGNTATVLSGEAKGETGIVTGKHGGIEHVMVDFDASVMEQMTIGDKIGIRSVGVGLELVDWPQITVFNCDPDFLDRLEIEVRDGALHVPVAKIVPAKIMGSGLGRSTVARGDYDIQCFDPQTVEEFGLADLRFGDIVAITDADHRYGRIYRTGAVSIGIVAHGRSFIAGHGPGVTSLLTAPAGGIIPRLDPAANIAARLNLRETPTG
jgi:hypothetical protein